MSFLEEFERNDIAMSLRYYGPEDFATGWDIKAIVEHPEIFDDFFERYPLGSLDDVDAFLLYLFAIKVSQMKEMIPYLKSETDQSTISALAGAAENYVQSVQAGDIIQFLNAHMSELFSEEYLTLQIRSIVLDYVSKYQKGLNDESLKWLSANYGYLLLDRFDDFEKMFENQPQLLSDMFPTGHYEEIDSFRFCTVLDIFAHIENRGKSNLKPIPNRIIPVLYEDMVGMADEITIENVMIQEQKIRKFGDFLRKIQSPLANVFTPICRKVEDLLQKSIKERGTSFEYQIPVGEMLDKWKNTEPWINRMLSLTHSPREIDGAIDFRSNLDVPPKPKDALLDLVSSNMPSDDYYSLTHQQMLSIYSTVGSSAMLGIIRDITLLEDYVGMMTSQVHFIAQALDVYDDHLDNDAAFLISHLQLIAGNVNSESNVIGPICYSSSMFLCAFSEKLLRLLYLYMAAGKTYVPIEKATIGSLLDINNSYMVEALGKDHIKNLAFFFQQTGSKKIGKNIRNSLAHWAGVSSDAMTVMFVIQLLWLYTDILNSVFWYFIKVTPEGGIKG